MEILKLFLTFLVGFATLVIGDVLWLWVLLKGFIVREFGALIVVEDWWAKINLPVGLLAWALIVVMIMIFVTKSWYGNSLKSTLWYGALLGFCLYGVYDLTNLTFLKNYSVHFAVVDVVWGAVICWVVATVMYVFSNFINKVL